VLGVACAFAGTAKPLFVIRRSKNANEIHFDANIGANGKINRANPVTAYWLLLAKGGQKQEMKPVDAMAYGFQCGYDKAGNVYNLVLKVFKKRKIKVYDGANGAAGPEADIDINGRPARLDAIFINETEKMYLPVVRYIELFGTDKAAGRKAYEKIIIHRLPKMPGSGTLKQRGTQLTYR